MLSIHASVRTVTPGVALAGAAPAASPQRGHDGHVPGLCLGSPRCRGKSLGPIPAAAPYLLPRFTLGSPGCPLGPTAAPPKPQTQSWPAWRETPQPGSRSDAPCGGALWGLRHPWGVTVGSEDTPTLEMRTHSIHTLLASSTTGRQDRLQHPQGVHLQAEVPGTGGPYCGAHQGGP